MVGFGGELAHYIRSQGKDQKHGITVADDGSLRYFCFRAHMLMEFKASHPDHKKQRQRLRGNWQPHTTFRKPPAVWVKCDGRILYTRNKMYNLSTGKLTGNRNELVIDGKRWVVSPNYTGLHQGDRSSLLCETRPYPRINLSETTHEIEWITQDEEKLYLGTTPVRRAYGLPPAHYRVHEYDWKQQAFTLTTTLQWHEQMECVAIRHRVLYVMTGHEMVAFDLMDGQQIARMRLAPDTVSGQYLQPHRIQIFSNSSPSSSSVSSDAQFWSAEMHVYFSGNGDCLHIYK